MIKEQKFRFCLRCVRMSLITDSTCHFCDGKFVLTSPKDDMKLRKRKEVAESY